MKLILFTTKADKGGQEIKKEARKMSLDCQIIFYEELFYKNGKIFNLNSSPLSIHRDDKIILRDPYNTNRDYSFFTQKILEKYYKNISLDRECYSKFPLCEDKLFQVDLFIKLGITTPKTFFGKKIKKELKFPVIVKPRIGSRSRGIRIFKKPGELQKFFKNRNTADYIVQKYLKVKNEYRILILKHKNIGIVQKKIYLKSKGRIGVTINKVANTLPEKIIKDATKISKALKADFIGIDVIQTKNDKYYFLEANLSPQFGGFAKVTKINVANKVIKLALT